jgi:fibronectin-binding autotransporter adhesin
MIVRNPAACTDERSSSGCGLQAGGSGSGSQPSAKELRSVKANPRPLRSEIEILESRIAPATLTVTTLSDSGSGSLRNAITTANGASGDKIVFSSSLKGTINLASALPTITSKMTIAGPGPGKIIINGNYGYQIFDIANVSTTNDFPVTISGLSIVDGSSIKGGGIFSTESLTLNNDLIAGSMAEFGAGVYVNGATALTAVNISHSLITGNVASQVGGGLNLSGKSITLTDTIVTGNTSASAGGMYAKINTNGTNLSVSGCQFTGNAANSVSGYAGGFVVCDQNTAASSKVTISNTIISGNTAQDSGGLVFGNGSASAYHALVKGCTIQNNSAVYFGGGIYASGFTGLSISSSVIEGNQVTGTGSRAAGGGLCIGGTSHATIIGTKILNNSAIGSGGYGGGVASKEAATLDMASCTVSGNSSTAGGGVYTAGPGNVKITGGTFSGNKTTAGAGGGMDLISDGLITVTGVKVNGNLGAGGGGGIAVDSTGAIVLDGIIASNNVSYANGGAISVHGGDNRVQGDTIFDNVAAEDGGGIYFSGAGGILSDHVFGNAAAVEGGGVYVVAPSDLLIQGSTITGNTASTGANPNIYRA